MVTRQLLNILKYVLNTPGNRTNTHAHHTNICPGTESNPRSLTSGSLTTRPTGQMGRQLQFTYKKE